jgi:hypothetical protein
MVAHQPPCINFFQQELRGIIMLVVVAVDLHGAYEFMPLCPLMIPARIIRW